MSQKPVEPVTETVVKGAGNMDETRMEHPAFATIGVSRVNGHRVLFQSDYEHNAFLRITIRKARLDRHINNDWVHGWEELIEVDMSEAQWATFVSSPNIGTGTPCTLNAINRQYVPNIPEPIDREAQFAKEVREDVQESIQAVDEALALLDELELPKGKAKQLRDKLETSRARLHSSVPWVAKMFEEHMEKATEKAKAEIHGYMGGVLQRAGIQALAQNMPLRIDAPGEHQVLLPPVRSRNRPE